MHFTVQVTRTQHAELDIEADNVIEAKLLARERAGDEAFDEADTEYKYSEPFRIFETAYIKVAGGFIEKPADDYCDYCGETTCHYDCDESQAGGFPQ